MDCFHDFCLACDRQSASGPYCSQACRLADLENANKSSSSPASPTLALSSSKSGHGQHSSPHQWSTPTTTAPPPNRYANSSPRNTNSTWSSTFMLGARPPSSSTMTKTSPSANEPLERSLTPSSSRSSLSSDPSGTLSSTTSTTPNWMSSQAQRELQGYFNSFDKSRSTRKRQWTW